MHKDILSSSRIPFAVVDAPNYYQDLVRLILRAKKRIVLVAMFFLWGEKTDAVLVAIEKALKQGVKVHILLDNFSSTAVAHAGMKASERRIRIAKTALMLKELETKGAHVSRFGKVGLNPFKGRCHVKITVVDDDAFSFGGVNFTDESFDNIDYMFHARNPEVADCLEQLADRIGSSKPPLPDAEVVLDEQSSILFDGGKPKQSIIYERASEFAAGATNIYAVSQMVPSGILGEILRYKQAEVYFNRSHQFVVPANWAQAFDEQKHRLRNRYTKSQFVHAKFMLFEMPDGMRISISGSNNFNYRGVAFGTQEIALQSADPEVWKQLYEYMRKHLT